MSTPDSAAEILIVEDTPASLKLLGDLLAGAGDVLTSNGHLHDQLVELVAGLPTGPRPHP